MKVNVISFVARIIIICLSVGFLFVLHSAPLGQLIAIVKWKTIARQRNGIRVSINPLQLIISGGSTFRDIPSAPVWAWRVAIRYRNLLHRCGIRTLHVNVWRVYVYISMHDYPYICIHVTIILGYIYIFTGLVGKKFQDRPEIVIIIID